MTTAKRNAFISGIESGKFNTDKAKIFNLLREKPMKLEQLIAYGFPEKVASARISDLMDLGLVSANGDDKSIFFVVTDQKQQEMLMQFRQNKAFVNWRKKGEENGWFLKLSTMRKAELQ